MAEAELKRLAVRLRKNGAILAVIFLGAVLLLLPRSCGEGDAAPADGPEENFSVAGEEARMAAALSRIEGAGEVTVVLALKSGEERILAADGGDGDRETVIVSTGSSAESPVVLKTVRTQYLGVLIVAQGADSPPVAMELKRAASVLTGLGQDRIAVAKMK